MVEISLAPKEEDVRMTVKEFFDLHEHLSKQLDECRGYQGPNAEPVNVPPPGEPTITAEEHQE
eukprot:6126474-Prorocentrum_lima.AAC.1